MGTAGRLSSSPRQSRGRFSKPHPKTVATAPPAGELIAALSSCRGALLSVALFSGVSNVLMLTGSFFMLQVYDRVLPSRSMATLVALCLLAVFLFAFQGIIDLIRGRIFFRVGAMLGEAVSNRVYETIVHLPLRTGQQSDGLQPLRDLDNVRLFMSGQGPAALFDLPWIPLYLVIIFAFHPLIGLTALAGVIALILVTIMIEVLTQSPIKAASQFATIRHRIAEASRRNAEVLAGMGMTERMAARWSSADAEYMASQRRASDVAGDFGAASRTLRLLLQSAVLAMGAYLVLLHEATAGIIIAGAILTARALAPVDLAIANWKGFIAARHSWHRMNKLLTLIPRAPAPLALPHPRAALLVEGVSCVPPGSQKLVVQDVSFALKGGHCLAIIGPSAAGKSSLVRMLVGAWHPARGTIRLDGAALDQWSPTALGRYTGYLPQDVELFAGTVAENIARFEPDADPEAIVAAACTAGVHELILTLPKGYETEIGEQGAMLSAGQRQRVALARALYRDPFLVVLDEPNSNLDAEGETALTQALLGIRARGAIAVVVAHRPSIMAGVDQVLAMRDGSMAAFGPKDEVLRRVLRPVEGTGSLKVTSDSASL